MKIKFLIILIILCFSCKNEKKEEKMPVKNEPRLENYGKKTKKIIELFKIKNSSFKIPIEYLENFDVLNDTLFFKTKNFIMKVSLKNKKLNYLEIDKAVFSDLKPSENLFVNNFKKDGENYYLTNFSEIIKYSNNSKLYNHKESEISIFTSFGENYSFICNYNKLKLLDKNLIEIDSINYQFINGSFVGNNKEFIYFEDSSSPLIHFYVEKNKIKTNSLPAIENIINIKNIDDFYISCLTDDYFVGFYYTNRDYIYFVDRKTYEIVNKIHINDNLTIPIDMVREEEGKPNLKIIFKNNTYYILGISKSKDIILLQINI